MTVTSKQCYATLRSELSDTLASLGFKRTRGGMLGWFKSGDEISSTMWFQCDKWGWDARWGSRFTVEFQRSHDPAPGSEDLLSRTRIGHMLEGHPEIEELREMNDGIIRNLPGYVSREGTFATIEGASIQVIGYSPSEGPYTPGSDVWLNYYSIADVEQWGRYFRSRIAHLIDVHSCPILSPLQEARARFLVSFEAARSKVVEGHDPATATSVLRDFIRVEPNDYFRQAAQEYLELICAKYPSAAI